VTAPLGRSTGPALDRELVRRAPKVVLHEHLDGSLRPRTVLELAEQIGYAERFNEMDPERKSGTVYLRGMVYVNLRDYDRAKKYLGDAVTYDPNGFYATLAQRRLEHLRPIKANVE